jgi:hypothetical protein
MLFVSGSSALASDLEQTDPSVTKSVYRNSRQQSSGMSKSNENVAGQGSDHVIDPSKTHYPSFDENPERFSGAECTKLHSHDKIWIPMKDPQICVFCSRVVPLKLLDSNDFIISMCGIFILVQDHASNIT